MEELKLSHLGHIERLRGRNVVSNMGSRGQSVAASPRARQEAEKKFRFTNFIDKFVGNNAGSSMAKTTRCSEQITTFNEPGYQQTTANFRNKFN